MLDQKLEDMSIFALREFARRVGVASPTSKKKEQLIAEIVEIREGKRQPSLNTQKHGRPPKNNNLFEQPPTYVGNNFGNIVLEQRRSTFKFTNISTVAGFVEVLPNNTALLWCNNNHHFDWLYIPSEVVFTSHILTGDFATVEVGIQDNQPCVKKVFNINGCPINKFDPKRHNYLDYKHILPSKKLAFENADYKALNLMAGESVYFYGTNNNENTQSIIKLLNHAKNVVKLYLNVSLAEKNIVLLDNLNQAEQFTAKITDEEDYVKRVISLCNERAKRLFEAGQNVVLVVDDVSALLEADGENKALTKSIISLTKNSNAVGSISLWAIMKNATMFDKLYDKRFKISAEKFVELES